jgi:hypothetical protein
MSILQVLKHAKNQWFSPKKEPPKTGERSVAPNSVSTMSIAPEKLAALRADDQLLISYPRSGNTWTRYMLLDLIRASRAEIDYRASIGLLIPDIHIQELDHLVQRVFEMPFRIFKSHNIWDLRDRRFVYIFREAGDCLVSYYHFERREKKERATSSTIDEYCMFMLPTWCAHMDIAQESKRARPDEVHFVSYERLLENRPAELHRIATFYGFDVTERLCAEIAAHNDFKNVAAMERGPSAQAQPFFRKGRVGASREELSPKTLSAIEAATAGRYAAANRLAAGGL